MILLSENVFEKVFVYCETAVFAYERKDFFEATAAHCNHQDIGH